MNADLSVDEWLYVMFTWKRERGLSIYIDGIRKMGETSFILTMGNKQTADHIVIGADQNKEKKSFLLMYLASIDLISSIIDYKVALEYAPPIFNNHYILTFSSIKKDYIEDHLQMKVHGPVKENRGTLVFDGIHGFLHDTGEYSGTQLYNLTSVSRSSFISFVCGM